MDQSTPAGIRRELTPPLDFSITSDGNTGSLDGGLSLPTLHPLSKPGSFDHVTQPSILISVEDGAEKLHGQQIPLESIPARFSVVHAIETSKEKPNVCYPLITPPPSSTPPDLAAKPRRRTASRCSITRKQATSCKRNLRSRISGLDKIMIGALPKDTRLFAKNEMRLSNAGAESDFLLTLPRPNHTYVDGRKRLTFIDSRFTVYGGKTNNTSYFITAGIPSNKPYAPHSPPVPVELATLNSLEDSIFCGITNDASQEDAFHARPSVKLIIPDVIKALLVDDWENVTKNTQLVPLPHPKPVTKILEDYSMYEMPKRPAGSSHADILEETLSGLKEYFDKSLGRILLYKFERPQYAEVHKKWNSTDPEFQGKTASDIYGAEHLCRLIVSLPELLAQTNMDQQSVNRLREELAKFCTWLSKNATEYFTSSYETPGQDYVDKAKN
ncbi:MRG-domain-containing protein [Xylaria sp. FL1777]|nr:MRG-domain-containing protein [Xylaria sp. FL1777]